MSCASTFLSLLTLVITPALVVAIPSAAAEWGDVDLSLSPPEITVATGGEEAGPMLAELENNSGEDLLITLVGQLYRAGSDRRVAAMPRNADHGRAFHDVPVADGQHIGRQFVIPVHSHLRPGNYVCEFTAMDSESWTPLASAEFALSVVEAEVCNGLDEDGDGLVDEGLVGCIPGPNEIEFQGLASQNEGFVGWWADGTGPEPAHGGHAIPAPLHTCWLGGYQYTYADAYYYIASPDHPFGSGSPILEWSTGGAHALATMSGFPRLQQALADAGYSAADLSFSFGPMTLGDDLEGSDWFVNGTVETRYYTGGEIIFTLDGFKLLRADMPPLTTTIDYADTSDCFDDHIVATTGDIPITAFRNVAGGAPHDVRTVARALREDIGDMGAIQLTMDDVQAAIQHEELDENGRTGSFFDIGYLTLD